MKKTDNKDIYKLLIESAQAYSEALASLNQRVLQFFEREAVRTALSKLSLPISSGVPTDIISPDVWERLESIAHSYTELLGNNDFGYMISESLQSGIADLQISTLFHISQSAQTPMMHDLEDCFVNAHYAGLVDVLNKFMSLTLIDAPDVAFIKTSKLVDVLSSELIYPRGFLSSLKNLSDATANDIVDNEDLQYSTENNKFLSADGEVDSTGLNVICSGKVILNQATGELFSESELVDFCSFLSRTPMLASSSDTGRKIYGFLQDLFHSGEKSTRFDKSEYYHCRSHKNTVQPFTYDQMLKAPNGLPWAGRYNHVGRSSYYFSDTKKGAESEVKKHMTNNDVLQTVKLKPVKGILMLDLSGSLTRGKTFLRYLRFSLSDVNDKMPREYLIPCYVSDCCKEIGFDGIKYYGAKDYSNYVAWNDGYFDYAGMA